MTVQMTVPFTFNINVNDVDAIDTETVVVTPNVRGVSKEKLVCNSLTLTSGLANNITAASPSQRVWTCTYTPPNGTTAIFGNNYANFSVYAFDDSATPNNSSSALFVIINIIQVFNPPTGSATPNPLILPEESFAYVNLTATDPLFNPVTIIILTVPLQGSLHYVLGNGFNATNLGVGTHVASFPSGNGKITLALQYKAWTTNNIIRCIH